MFHQDFAPFSESLLERGQSFPPDSIKLLSFKHSGLIQQQVFLRDTLTEDHEVVGVNGDLHTVVDESPDGVMGYIAHDTECYVAARTNVQSNSFPMQSPHQPL